MIKNIRIEYEGKFGDDIRETVKNMTDYAVKAYISTACEDIIIHTVFNGISVDVDKNTRLNDAVEKYHKDLYLECYKEYMKEGCDERLSKAHNEYKEIIDAIEAVNYIINCKDIFYYVDHILMCAKMGYFNKNNCLKYISISALLGKMEDMNEKYPSLMEYKFKDSLSVDKYRFMYQNVYKTLKECGRCSEEVVNDYKI